jgi:glycosyltransferase involved in cell wall biosynthesis
MLSLETKFFDPQGSAAERLRMYERLATSLDVLVPERRHETPGAVRLANNVLVHPVRKSLKPIMVIRLIRKAISLGREASTVPLVVTSQDPFELGLAAYVIARVLKAALHLQVHTDIGNPYFKNESLRRHIQVLIARFLLQRADAVRVVSSRVKESVVALGVQPKRVMVVPITTPWRELEQQKSTIDLKKAYPALDPIILTASRLSHEKNVALAIRAFAAIAMRHPRVGLVIVGDGPEEKRLKQEAAKHGLGRRIIFEGWSDDVISCMKSADIFMLTSDYEGWAVSVVEAAAARIPVVMTDVGCAREFLIPEESALVVAPRDEKAFTSALDRLLSSPEERSKLTEAAYRRLAMISDQETYEHAVLDSYRQALQHHEAPHPHTKDR